VGAQPQGVSEYNRTVALVLFLFLGGFGAHYYYVGRIGTLVELVQEFFL